MKIYSAVLALAVVAGLALNSVASAQIVNETFSSSSTLVGSDGLTTSSSISGNPFTLVSGTTTGSGFEIFSPSADGGNGLRFTNESGRMAYADPLTGFTNGGSFQVAALIRFELPASSIDANNEIFGVYLGNGNFAAVSFAWGTDSLSTPFLVYYRWSSNSINDYTGSSISGVVDGQWMGLVMQYDPPSTVGGVDGGFHLWLDPTTSVDSPLISHGSGVTGGTGIVALGSDAARPANSNLSPGNVGFGNVLAGANIPVLPVGSIDDVALWDGPVNLTGGDATLLQAAINYLAAARAAKVDSWLMY